MKLNKKHFELFKKECQYWIDKFELNNWKVYFVLEEIGNDRFAEILPNLTGYVATIKLNKNYSKYGVENLIQSIKQSAKHEVIHLLLARLSVNGQTRYVNEDDIKESEEELVRKLENIIKK